MTKKLYLFLFIFFVSVSPALSQTLFTYGNKPVSKDEFFRAYNKNKTEDANNEKALQEYLDLYIRFKLKVQAAKDLGYDTLSGLKSELQNFRSQIEGQYLQDDAIMEDLLNEAFNRSQKDIHITHIFIPFTNKSNLSDTTEAFKGAQYAYERLTVNKIALSTAVAELGRQNIQATYNDVGFITVFSLPYDLENIVYGLKEGAISKPYKTSRGYHIFQHMENRPAMGKMKVAQILISVPSVPDKTLQDAAFRRADSVYKLLLGGADFATLARNVSTDQTSYMTGGVLPEFGTGSYDDAFERPIVSLQKDGDITRPFQTPFGYHIVKRISRTTVPDKRDLAYMAELRQKLQSDDRHEIAKKKFIKDVYRKIGYKKNPIVKEALLWQLTDSFLVTGKKKAVGNISEKTTVFSFSNSQIRVNEWLQFARDYKLSPELYKGEAYNQLMEKYVELAAFENYRKRLEHFNPAFKYQLQEFREGNMLFEVMEKNIWSKAANDSVALKLYYAKNKPKYLWNESADVIIFSAANADVANQIRAQLKTGRNWRTVVEEYASQVQSDSGRYEISQIPGSEKMKFTPGSISEVSLNSTDGTASFIMSVKQYSPNQQRTFEEARGLVINDYQGVLEQQWIDQLKKKYPIKINEAVFRSLVNS